MGKKKKRKKKTRNRKGVNRKTFDETNGVVDFTFHVSPITGSQPISPKK